MVFQKWDIKVDKCQAVGVYGEYEWTLLDALNIEMRSYGSKYSSLFLYFTSSLIISS